MINTLHFENGMKNTKFHLKQITIQKFLVKPNMYCPISLLSTINLGSNFKSTETNIAAISTGL